MTLYSDDPTPRHLEDLPDLLTRRQLSKYTGVAVQTLARWVTERKGPTMTKLGQAVRYRKSDVIAWIEASRS